MTNLVHVSLTESSGNSLINGPQKYPIILVGKEWSWSVWSLNASLCLSVLKFQEIPVSKFRNEEIQSFVTVTMFNLFTELCLLSTFISERSFKYYIEHSGVNFIKTRDCWAETYLRILRQVCQWIHVRSFNRKLWVVYLGFINPAVKQTNVRK